MILRKFMLSIIALLVLIVAAPAYASSSDIQVFINDKKQQYDVNPIMVNNSVLVPIRPIFNSLQVDFKYDVSTKTITTKHNNATIELQINNPIAKINKENLKLNQPPTIINGYTYVPIRFISESFKAQVTWDSKANVVRITYATKAGIFESITGDDFETYSKLLGTNPLLANDAVEHVIFANKGLEWTKVALHAGADPQLALSYAVTRESKEIVAYILDKKLVSSADSGQFDGVFTYFGLSTPETTIIRLIYKTDELRKLYTFEQTGSAEIAAMLYNYGFRPNSNDILTSIKSYPDAYIAHLDMLLGYDADPNGITAETVLLKNEYHDIHFYPVAYPPNPSSKIPVIETAFRVIAWNPDYYNIDKFDLLVIKYGASLAPLDAKQLDRLIEVISNSDHTALLDKIKKERTERG